MISISKRDKHRLDRIFNKYLSKHIQSGSVTIPIKWVTNFWKYGNKTSIYKNDIEVRLLGFNRKQVLALKKVNIVNHFINSFYFAREIVLNSETKKIGVDNALFTATMLLLALSNARMLTGHINRTEELIKKNLKISGRGQSQLRQYWLPNIAKMAKFVYKKPYQAAVKKYEKGELDANEGTNISFVIFEANRQARYGELGFF